MTPETVLAEVERVMSRPFEWGPCDCCSAACDVFAALWGFDPMAALRGYHGLMGAVRLLDHGGGLEEMADRHARRAGLRAGHATGGLAFVHFAPELGLLHGPRRVLLASLLICIQPGQWAGKSRNGFAILRSADKGWHA
ncbi:DUF6950 family protein [Paracoccus siganidrum]|uniref:DUF6950 family protein n=1 Tax=Paracoccus siganidrum TaxID=1276757 RepID=UPI0011C46BC3|nr:hypothetical protein [Paracoccus siganidrum]